MTRIMDHELSWVWGIRVSDGRPGRYLYSVLFSEQATGIELPKDTPFSSLSFLIRATPLVTYLLHRVVWQWISESGVLSGNTHHLAIRGVSAMSI